MNKSYEFKNQAWQASFDYVYSPNCQEYKKFEQTADCIKNNKGNYWNGYEYISILEKGLYQSGVTISTLCSFESFGAPLLVFTNEVIKDGNGNYRFGVHYEVVAYENGCNVWLVEPKTEGDKKIKSTLLSKLEFSIQNNENIQIIIDIEEKNLNININGHKLDVTIPDFPDKFRVGITACEGLNRFYNLKIED